MINEATDTALVTQCGYIERALSILEAAGVDTKTRCVARTSPDETIVVLDGDVVVIRTRAASWINENESISIRLYVRHLPDGGPQWLHDLLYGTPVC